MTTSEIAAYLKIELSEVRKVLDALHFNYDLHKIGKGKNFGYYIRLHDDAESNYVISPQNKKLQELKFGMFSDMHIGCRQFDEKGLRDKLSQAVKDGYEHIYISGDIHDGNKVYKGQNNNLLAWTLEDQVELSLNIFKDYDLHYKAIGGNHDYCISEDTEIFTLTGWKTIHSLTTEDSTITLDKNLNSSFEKIEKIIRFPNSKTFLVSGRGMSLCCTANHKTPFLTQDSGKLKFRTIGSLNKADVRVPVSTILQNKDYPISDELLKLVAWILTDGSCERIGNYVRYRIYQSKKEMILRIKNLLEKSNLKYCLSWRDRSKRNLSILGKNILKQQTSCVFSMSAADIKELKRLLPSKEVPNWLLFLSKRQFDMFLEELILGDGSKYKNKTARILYGKESFLESVQTFCHLFGYRATVTKSKRGDYRLNICQRTIGLIRKSHVKENTNHEPTWCIQIKNHNFMVRHRGKICFTGNSWEEQGSINPTKLLAKQMTEAGKKFKYLGTIRADILLGGIAMRLLHGAGGSAYAVSYPGQVYLRNVLGQGGLTVPIGGEDHPLQILQIGHFHTHLNYSEYGVEVVHPGNFQRPNDFTERRGLRGQRGCYFVDLEIRNGKLQDFTAKWSRVPDS